MAPRRVFLSLVVVVLAVFTATTVSAQDATTTVTTTSNSTVAPSFCELCRDKGNCAQAYKGVPGIFCGAWLNVASQRMACCCPSNDQCAKTPSNYECKCQRPKANKAAKATTSPKAWIIIVVAVLVLAIVAVGLYFYCSRGSNDNNDNNDYEAHPNSVVVVHSSAHGGQPVYSGGQAGYDQKGYSGGTVAAAAAGGAAIGLVGGVAIDSMMADSGHSNGGGSGGNHSSGGGDKLAGDF